MFTNKNKKSKRFMYTAVAAVEIFATTMIPQVQVAAMDVASYFANAISSGKVVNEGIKDENGVTQNMVKNGQSIPIDDKITNQDFTIHFKELYVGDSRISVHYRIEKVDGNLVRYEFDTVGKHLKSDGKVNEETGRES